MRKRKSEKILNTLKKIKLNAEEKYFFRKYGKVVSKLKKDPIFQARILHGVVLPPHERVILRFTRYPQFTEFHLIGGRGVAKSFALCSMTPTLEGEISANKKITSLSASKFRGGKVIMEEALSFLMGRLSDQKPLGPYAKRMLEYGAGLKREGDRWYIPFTTHSFFYTVPTGNMESIRGLRSNDLFLDEADNWVKEDVDKILEPFLAVGKNFESPGAEKRKNRLFWTGTVTYTHKTWAKTLQDRERLIKRQYEAHRKLKVSDFEGYRKILNEDNERVRYASVCLQRWDYTDLIIPTKLDEHNVYYPSINRTTKEVEINPDRLLNYDRKEKRNYVYTYPVEKHRPEEQLEDGLTDFDTWAAEWRCQFIETSGNVYPFDLIEKARNTELVNIKDLSTSGWDIEERGVYFPPVLYECSDPCVLAVDPARTSDFVAFVVIRLGELATGKYNPITGTGHTPWNNVIWAEQRRGLTIKEVCEKIWDFQKRYNLHVSENPEKAPAIIIDARGAMSGTTIQDELARPSPSPDENGNIPTNWVSPTPMYDPLDKAYKDLRLDRMAWPGLRLLWTTDQINTQLVGFSKGQLEISRLYIAKGLSRSERYDKNILLDPGHIGVQVLADQLTAIQAKPTTNAFKYEMPGDSRRVDMKKDLFSAFLYGVYGLRQHLASLVRGKKSEPVAAFVLVKNRRSLFNNSLHRK